MITKVYYIQHIYFGGNILLHTLFWVWNRISTPITDYTEFYVGYKCEKNQDNDYISRR